MKLLVMSLCLFMSASSFAFNLKSVNTRTHISPKKFMDIEVHRAQQVLARYLEQEFDCEKVKLCLTDYTEHIARIFRTIPGNFTMELSATCKKEIKDFKFDVSLSTDWEDYSDVLIGYKDNGKWIEKDIVSRLSGEDFRTAKNISTNNDCDSSPVDKNLPFKIITRSDMLRSF